MLVEGASDMRALEALARRRGRDLQAEGVAVVPIGGATNIGHFLERFGPNGFGLRLAGLCDAGEEPAFRRAIDRSGLGSPTTRADMELMGFFVCDRDLEDELIRALGADAVMEVLAASHILGPFRTFQKQPAWHGRTREEQLRRFLGTTSGRKIEIGAALVEALDLGAVPRPLDGVLSYAEPEVP